MTGIENLPSIVAESPESWGKAMIFSFRTRVFVSMLSVVLLAGGLIGLAVSKTVTPALSDEYKERGLALAINLAARCEDPLLAVDFLRLKNMVDETVNSSDGIAYAFIMDERSKVLAHTFEGGFPVALKTANSADERQHCSVRLIDTGKELIYDFAAPVTAGDDRVGMVRLGLSRRQEAMIIRQILWNIFSLLGLSLFVAALVAFSLSDRRHPSDFTPALGLESGQRRKSGHPGRSGHRSNMLAGHVVHKGQLSPERRRSPEMLGHAIMVGGRQHRCRGGMSNLHGLSPARR